MKRFYCTICKKTKRVRVYPSNVVGVENEQPTSRIGTCSWHTRSSNHGTARVGITSRQKVGA